jgi:membrane protein
MTRILLRWLRKTALVRNLQKFAEHVSLPGFGGLSLYEVSMFFYSGINKGSLRTRAASMAYHFFIAIFPSVIFLFTLIAYIPIDNFQQQLFELIHQIMPENVFSELQDTIDGIINRQRSGLLSFGFLAALYFSTGGMRAMMEAFNKSIHMNEKRLAWKHQLIAISLVFILTLLILFAVVIMIGSELILSRLVQKDNLLTFMVIVGRWSLLGLFILIVIGVYYRYGPAKRMHQNLISPGALLSTALIILTSILFTWYVNNFGRYNSLYGSIGTIIVFLLFIFYNSMMLLVGFELDASIATAGEKSRWNSRSKFN